MKIKENKQQRKLKEAMRNLTAISAIGAMPMFTGIIKAAQRAQDEMIIREWRKDIENRN